MGAALVAPPAAAANPVFIFNINRQDLESALITLALQANLSIGRRPEVLCAATRPRLKGRLTVDQALSALLKNSGCSYRRLDPHTVLIIAAAAPPEAAAVVPKAKPPSAPEPLAADLVVTGARRAESIERSPYDETRLSGAALLDARGADIGGLASLVAGMTVTNLGPGRDKILLRGLSDGVFTGRTQSTVALYLDDVPLTYNAPDPDLCLVDIDDVEVLRGPQGVLYGAGSIGGVVHVITNKPDLKTLSGSLQTTADATRGADASWATEGVLNLPLIDGRAAARLVAYRETDGGYINDPVLGRHNVNETTRTGARAQILAQLTPVWKITFGGIYQSINSADSQYAVAGYGTFGRPNVLAEPHDNDFNELSLVVEGAGAGWRFKSSTSRVHHQIVSRYDASDALGFFAPKADVTAEFDQTDRKSIVTQEFTLASDTPGPLQWIAGLFALNDHETSVSRLSELAGPATDGVDVYLEDRVDGLNEAAAYGELTYSPMPNLYLTLGGRIFQSDGVTSATVQASSIPRTSREKVRDQGLAPKAVARYQISSSAMVYLQATEGYRSSGLNTSGPAGQAPSENAAGSQPFERYGGDELWNYEAGAKVSMMQSKLIIRAALFYDSWQNIQTDQILASGLPDTVNVGDGVNEGIEVEALFQPLPDLSVGGNAVLNDPELIDRAVGSTALADASLPGVARATAGLNLAYRHTLSPAVAWFANARVSYVGSSTVGFDQTTAATMGRYATGQVTVGVDVGNYRLEAFVDNPANTRGNTFAFGNPFSLRQTRQTTPLRPRTLGVTLRAEF